MSGIISIDALRSHLDNAKDRLSLEKASILQVSPLSPDFKREEYAFAYVRAERLGMKALNHRLAEIAWLPMQLDPSSEILSEGRNSMKRWLSSAMSKAPDSDEFGNDFMHALTRTGLIHGWDTVEYLKISKRIADLFCELSCLIGIVYYCTWLSEHGVTELRISKPDNLNRTAEEIAALLQSPEIYRQLKAKEQNDAVKSSNKKTSKKSKSKPPLHVINNKDYYDPYVHEPWPVS